MGRAIAHHSDVSLSVQLRGNSVVSCECISLSFRLTCEFSTEIVPVLAIVRKVSMFCVCVCCSDKVLIKSPENLSTKTSSHQWTYCCGTVERRVGGYLCRHVFVYFYLRARVGS